MTGGTLGTWTLGEEIGRGPHGTVYRATGPDGRTAAVKVLHHPVSRDPGFQKRFPAEMLALRRLSHPTIARALDAGVTAGACWYASELVDGVSLAATLADDAPGLPWADDGVRRFALLTRGLMHAHHRSLLHRDLKPSNVLLTPDGGLRLTDFGLAKLIPTPPLELPADAWGTAGYLAPEGFAGRPLTKRTDLYSLGAVAYTLITGRPPFRAATAADFLHKHTYALPERPALFAPDLPTDLDDLICGLLAKDPARRPGSADLVLAALEQVRDRQARKGRVVRWPIDVGQASETTAALVLDEPAAESRPLMKRPAVVLPLFLLVVGLMAWGVLRPRPDAEAALATARPLLQSPTPADWVKAWDEHLSAFAGTTGPHAEEVEAAHTKARAARLLASALKDGRRASGDAERLYLAGLGLVRAGEVGAARRVWGGLVLGFAGDPDASLWVGLASGGLAELGTVPAADHVGLTAAVERLSGLPPEQAAAARAALAEAYRDDPAALTVIEVRSPKR